MWRLRMGGVGTQWWMARLLAVSTAVLALVAVSAAQPASEEDLAKETQNPVSDLISVPFESNFNFGVGPNDDLQYILYVQPVVPFRLSKDWNLITRTIIPLIDQPELGPGVGDVFGLGDIQLSQFLSPAKSGALIWGIGPIFQFPTATDDALGSDKWSAGPTAAALTIRGPWVAGALVNHLWSFAGDDDRADVNQTLIQPIVNYNLPGGWFLSSVPYITANWETDGDDRWTVPIGIGVGKVHRFGTQPVSLQLTPYYNVVRPDDAAEWTLRFRINLLFPK
jgi:hypothetical protein